MSIRTRLIIAVVVAILLAAGGIAATLATRAAVTQANKRNNLVREIVTQLLALNILRADYQLYRSDRARVQWENEQKRLTALLAEASTLFPGSDATIKRLRDDGATRQRLFEALVSDYQAEATGKGDPKMGAEIETRLVDSLLVLSQSTIDAANALAARSQSDLSGAQNLSTALATVFVALLGLVVLAMALLVSRTVLSSLGKLKAGADAVAGGDLGTRIAVKSEDEIGAVTDSFNHMTRELQALRNNLEEQVDSRTLDLKRANEELDAYAQVISHDLRGPLSAALLSNALLKDSAQDANDEELRGEMVENADMVVRNLVTAENMVTGLLKVAEAGQKPHSVTDVSISEVVGDLLQERKASIDETSTRLNIDKDLGTIRADRTQMYQVFSNLIGNCIRYNDNPEPVIAVNYLGMEEGSHLYRVCDNGSGFPEDDIDKIFRPFFKGAGTLGTGIGLSIVDKVILAYGGWIKASNEDGACFNFAIPDWKSG